MRPVTLEDVLACPGLPSLPTVAMDVLALTRNRNLRLEEVAAAIQNDQALSAKILRTVNSSFYALSAPCPSITRALTFLGLSTVKSLVLGFSLVDTSRESQSGLDLMTYWRRCIYSAAASRRIALLSSACDPEEAFTAALMQDIGMPAIHSALGEAYGEITAQAGEDHERLCAAEVAALGFDHAEAGAKLGERWRLPEQIIEVIRRHHRPEEAAEGFRALVRVVTLGATVASALTVSDAGPPLARLRALAAEWFGFSAAQADALLATISEDAGEVARLFRIDTGQAPNLNAILAQAQEAALQHQFAVQREAETLRQTNTDLARRAITDALTGVGNRSFFDSELTRLFNAARSSGGRLAVIMVDADWFKSVNDTYGHQGGDEVLIEIARRMKDLTRAGAIVCRYGGEEFAVLVPGGDQRTAARVAETLRQAIEAAPVQLRQPQARGSSLKVTASLGVACFDPAQGSQLVSPELLVHAADKALYAAKESGRNSVRVFTERRARKVA